MVLVVGDSDRAQRVVQLMQEKGARVLIVDEINPSPPTLAAEELRERLLARIRAEKARL